MVLFVGDGGPNNICIIEECFGSVWGGINFFLDELCTGETYVGETYLGGETSEPLRGIVGMLYNYVEDRAANCGNCFIVLTFFRACSYWSLTTALEENLLFRFFYEGLICSSNSILESFGGVSAFIDDFNSESLAKNDEPGILNNYVEVFTRSKFIY